MLHIGCHLSSGKGFRHMGQEALSIKADTFQFFTRNPRGSKAKKVDAEDAAALAALVKKHDFTPLLAHAPYTLNASSADSGLRDFARRVMAEDINVLEAHLPGNMYNFHPGSHVGQGVEAGIGFIADLLNDILRPEQKTLVLLETMSGKGSEIGRTFEELQMILERVHLREKMGVCLDTCHVFSAGYDIVGRLDGILEHFDAVIGLDRLKAVHLNDSMMPFGAHKDRHEKIGSGRIGREALIRFINHPRLCHLPFYLETPNDVAGYAREIRMLRRAYAPKK